MSSLKLAINYECGSSKATFLLEIDVTNKSNSSKLKKFFSLGLILKVDGWLCDLFLWLKEVNFL